MDRNIWPGKSRTTSRIYIQLLCEDKGCSPEDLPEAMNDREKRQEWVRDIRASSTTRWGWWWWSIAVLAFAWSILTPFLVDVSLLPRYPNLSTNFRRMPFRVSFKTHSLRFVCVDIATYTPSYLLQAMQQGLVLGRCISKKRYIICIVCVPYIFCGVSSALAFI